jgi:hypothetical protein
MTPEPKTPPEPNSTDTQTVLWKDQARQGVTGNNVRYVLGISLVAIVVAFAVIYFSYFAA